MLYLFHFTISLDLRSKLSLENLPYILAFQKVFHPTLYFLSVTLKVRGGRPRGLMVKAIGCGIVVSEFVHLSRYYVHFRTNTLGKVIEPPYPPRSGLNSTTTVCQGE